MNEGDRIARLEERVAALEEELRRAAGQRGSEAGEQRDSGAAGQQRREPERSAVPLTPTPTTPLWALAGVMVLFGVTSELGRYFDQKAPSSIDANLAAGLAVSAWWLLFAAVLVAVGFRRDLKPARLAGLAVAGLAVIKVLAFDLAALDALYRVGAVFILGLVFLLLAYLYHRQGRGESRQSAV